MDVDKNQFCQLKMLISYFKKMSLFFVHFLFAQKTNQKRAPEMTNFAIPYARYTGHKGATGMSKFRSISGLPARL